MSTEKDFEPQVVAFCCRHCAYAAADLAGSSRLSYPAAVKIVELPCTGRVDMLEMLHALEKGADGVLVAGCLPGTCHYINGNTHARMRLDYVSRLLEQIGLEKGRVAMINISAAMGAQFARQAAEFVASLRELGPTPLAGGTKKTPEPAAPAEIGR